MAAQCEIEVAEAANLGQHPKTLRDVLWCVTLRLPIHLGSLVPI